MVLSSGFVALLNTAMMLLFYTSLASGYSRLQEVFVSSIIVTVLSTSIFVYFLHRRAMTAHYDWFKLRLYKQLRQLWGRRTMWCMVILSMTSSFMLSFISTAVFVMQGVEVMALFQVAQSLFAL